MHSYRCSYQMCSGIPKWMCACSSPPILLCQTHLGVHIISNSPPSCSPQIFELQPVNAESKIKFIQHIKSQEFYIKKTKKDLIAQASHINDLVSKVLIKALRDLKKLEMHSSLLLKEAINTDTNCTPFNEVGYILSKNPDEINNLLPSWNFSEFLNPINEICTNLEQYLDINSTLIGSKIIQSCIITSSPLSQPIPTQSFPNPVIQNSSKPQEIPLSSSSLIFYHSTNRQIIEIDTNTNTSKDDSINLESYMSQGISMIRLPNNTIFCYGDTDDNRRGSTFIIESTSRIKHLENGWPCKWASLVYLNETIYAFGGLDGRSKLDIFRRFDTRWNRPGKMPCFIGYSSAATFQGKAYVVDYEFGYLYSFDPDTSNFQRIQTFKASALKLLFSDMDNLYVVESGGSIYMGLPPQKLVKVHAPLPNLFADRLVSPILVVDSFAYYVALQSKVSEYVLYKFDMRRRVNSKEKEWL